MDKIKYDMITEDYVTFEIAKLLKEKGFNETCTHVYNIENERNLEADFYTSRYVHNSWLDKNEPRLIAAPSLQMAMKWLREVHKIHIVIYPYGDYSCDNYQFDVYKDNGLVVSKDDGYITYEQACEAAIKYCLENLI